MRSCVSEKHRYIFKISAFEKSLIKLFSLIPKTLCY